MAESTIKCEDSGWQTLSSTYGVTYRKVGKIVFVCMLLNGGQINPNTDVGTLPEGFRPSTKINAPNYRDGKVWVSIFPDGNVSVGTSSAGVYWVNLTTSYPIN